MDKCQICNSQYLSDINKMISQQANDKHIQSWCKERGFKLTLKAIKQHRRETSNTIKVKSHIDDSKKIYLSPRELQEKLNLTDEEANNYRLDLSQNSQNTSEFLEIINDIIDKLKDEISQLKDELDRLSNHTSQEKISNLKKQKLTEQVRLQNAIANLQEIKLKQLQGKLISSDLLEEKWSHSLVGFKAKLEAIPSKVALQLSSIDDEMEIENILNKLILESVEELTS